LRRDRGDPAGGVRARPYARPRDVSLRGLDLASCARPVVSLPEKLDLARVKRLRQVVTGAVATESELRTLAEQADGWARATAAQLRAAETRLARLNADPASELGDMAIALRRVEDLNAELEEARSPVRGRCLPAVAERGWRGSPLRRTCRR